MSGTENEIVEEMAPEMEEQRPLPIERMREALKAALANRWQEFQSITAEVGDNLLNCFDLCGNTAIHLATRSNNPRLLRELLQMLPGHQMWSAMWRQNCEGNTLLHEIALCKEVAMVEVVLEFEQSLRTSSRPAPESVLELRNKDGETPLFVAAKNGNLKILQHMTTHVMGDHSRHWHRSDSHSALHASVIGEHFDVALWLVRTHKELAGEKDQYGSTCLQLLSKMPHVFRSHTNMGLVRSLIYYLLPNEGYEIEDSDRRKDLENGTMEEMELPRSVISRINYGFWKNFSEAFKCIDHMWERKKKHNFVECLVDVLVKYDLSWQESYNGHKRTLLTMPPHPLHVDKRRREIESMRLEHRQDNSEESLTYSYTPLLLAASTGVLEIVEKILDMYPGAIHHVSNDGQNVLHMAIKHRQKKVFAIIRKKKVLKSLALQITEDGYTILHQVARMDYYSERPFERTTYEGMEGVAFQLQDELRWYDRVRKVVRPDYCMHLDKFGLTAEQVFNMEHGEMLEAARKWIKETAQACTVVAAVIVSVVFAAGYTQPGESDDKKKNGAHHSILAFFIFSNLMPLGTSVASSMLFLSILTSRLGLRDFHNYLPRKLMAAFALLMVSVCSTLLPFSAAISLNLEVTPHVWRIVKTTMVSFVPLPFSCLLFSWLKTWFRKLENRLS